MTGNIQICRASLYKGYIVHLCLVLQSSGNLMLGGLKNCTDCKDFLFERLVEVFLIVTLFSITTNKVSLMCRGSVDFHEPIYHRLLSRFYISEPLFSFFKVFECFFQMSMFFNSFFWGFFFQKVDFSPLAELLHVYNSFHPVHQLAMTESWSP